MRLQNALVLGGDVHMNVAAQLRVRPNDEQSPVVASEIVTTSISSRVLSTVFLGIDHSWDNGPPVLFETMVFGGNHDQYQERCSTWKQAEDMHERACALVRGVSG